MRVCKLSAPAGESPKKPPGVNINDLEFHELAGLFPLLPDAGTKELGEDIKKRGLEERITLLDGKVLDGRNRYLAGKQAGYNFGPEDFTDFDPETQGDPLAFVISKNLKRRHLTDRQREQIAGDILAMTPEAKRGPKIITFPIGDEIISKDISFPSGCEIISKDKKAEELAEQFHVTKHGVEAGAKVRKHDPAKADEIKAGSGSARKAADAIKVTAPKITAEQQDEAMEEIRRVCGDKFYYAIKEWQIPHLKDPWDIRAFTDLTEPKMQAFMEGLAKGWTVKQCERWTHEEITAAHSFAAAIYHAQSLGESCERTFNFGGHVFRYTDESTPEQRLFELPEPPPLFKPKKTAAGAEPQPTREQFVGFLTANNYDAKAAGEQWDIWNTDNWCTTDGRRIAKWRGLALKFAKQKWGMFSTNGSKPGGRLSPQQIAAQKIQEAEEKARREEEDNR
jgi:hypothetical protein